jgi:hypothetical protein
VKLRASLALVGTLLLGGCGDGDLDVNQAEETAVKFWDALAAGDRAAACDLTGRDFSDTCDEDVRTIGRDEVTDAYVARSAFDAERSTAYVAVCIPASTSLPFVPAVTNVEFVEESWRIQGFTIADPDHAPTKGDRQDFRHGAKELCGDRAPSTPAEKTASVARLRDFAKFELYYLGRSFAGERLTSAECSGKATECFFGYGSCDASPDSRVDDTGCAIPLDLQNRSICARFPALFRPRPEVSRVAGAIVSSFDGIDVHTRRTTITVYGAKHVGGIERVIGSLRSVRTGKRARDLPPPAPGGAGRRPGMPAVAAGPVMTARPDPPHRLEM